MDTLASRGENKVDQNTKSNTIPNPTAYTGANSKAFPLQMGGVAFVIVLLFLMFRQK